jgi:hypothetical protein
MLKIIVIRFRIFMVITMIEIYVNRNCSYFPLSIFIIIRYIKNFLYIQMCFYSLITYSQIYSQYFLTNNDEKICIYKYNNFDIKLYVFS